MTAGVVVPRRSRPVNTGGMNDGPERLGVAGADSSLNLCGGEGSATGQGNVCLRGRGRANGQPDSGGRGAPAKAAVPRDPAELEPGTSVSGCRMCSEDVISRRAGLQGLQLPNGPGGPRRRSRRVLGEAVVRSRLSPTLGRPGFNVGAQVAHSVAELVKCRAVAAHPVAIQRARG